MAIKCDADRGVCPCPECRHTNTRLNSLIDTVALLVNAVSEIGVKLTSSKKAREEERAAAAAESATLRQQNELLRCNVATLGEQMTTLTWKTFRLSGQPSSLLIGSIMDVRKENLYDTDVVCLRRGQIADVRSRLEALPSGYDSITLLVGGNDCDAIPPPPAATIVDSYGELLEMAQVKARKVIVPRTTSEDTHQTIDAVNAGLVSLCSEKAVKFADNTPSFTLRDGSVNDGYIQSDGVRVTRPAMEKIAKNLGLQVKDTARGVCGDGVRKGQPAREAHRPHNQQRNDDDGWSTVRRPPRRNQRPRQTSGSTHTTCYFCGAEGHVKDNCRHGRKVECHSCHRLGHKAKYCPQ